MNCPQCGKPLREGKQFCTNCGTRTAHGGRESLSESIPTVERAGSGGAGGASAAETVAAAKDPLVGRVLDGKYELLGRLGEGGMGAVYRAARVHIGDVVAVKVLHSNLVTDETLIERFRREARAAAQLHHPNVVTIHDYGEARGPEGFAYIVMELVPGVSLRKLLQLEGKLGVARAVSLMRDICAGVGAAHRRDIVHRDIKPDNIIVQPADEEHERERIKVVDFGIAKLRDLASGSAITQTGVMVGTPFYMSPEQCQGEDLDARADVYSLGALLHEMLAGAPPFTAPSISGVLAKHLTQPPPPLAPELNVPVALQAAITRSLSKEPGGRQRDAAEFAREIQAAVAEAHATGEVRTTGEVRPTGDVGPAPPTAPVFPAVQHPAAVTPVPAQPVHTPTNIPAQQTYPQHAAGPQTYPHAPPPQTYAPPPRKSRAPLVIGLIILLVIGGGVLAVAGLIWLGSQNTNERVNVNANSRRQPTPRPPNTNGGQTASTPMERAEQKIVSGAALTTEDLAPLSPSELRLLRNVVFARHGRTFQASELQQYFARRPWYKPRSDFSEKMLTAGDIANADLIKAYESGGGKTAPAADAATVQREVNTTLNGWAASTTGRNLSEHMTFYADTLETYYLKQNVPAQQVHSDRARAFARFDSMDVTLSNVQIKPDPTGTRAVAVFDKTWEFEADDKTSTGSVRQQLNLARFGDRWLIVGEKDLQVHYQNSEEY